MTPENKSGEWAAESQSCFETPEQIAIIDEIKAKKEIWPWVEDEGDGTIELRKSLLKQGGKLAKFLAVMLFIKTHVLMELVNSLFRLQRISS